MTGSTPNGQLPPHRAAGEPVPGDGILKLARRIFDEPALSTIVIPALADFQQEMREAGDGAFKRIGARVRGYLAFARLVLSAPFITPSAPLGAPVTTMITGKYGGNLLLVLAVALFVAIAPIFGWFAVAVLSFGSVLAFALRAWNTHHPDTRSTVDPLLLLTGAGLLAAIWSMFGWFVVATMVSAVVMAVVLRRWNDRYPSALAPAQRDSRPSAEINLSSIPVAGDFGGLLFVIGAIITVLLGLPDIRWFVLGSVIAGGILAGGLFVWRSAHHTSRLTPANSILQRNSSL